MAVFRECLRRLWGALRRNPADHDLERELRFHLEQAEEELRGKGHSPAEAARLARVRLGGFSQTMEALRDQRGWPWLDDCQATSGIDPPATPKTDPPKKRRMLLKWGTQRRCISVATDHRPCSRGLVYESKDDDACGFCGRRLRRPSGVANALSTAVQSPPNAARAFSTPRQNPQAARTRLDDRGGRQRNGRCPNLSRC